MPDIRLKNHTGQWVKFDYSPVSTTINGENVRVLNSRKIVSKSGDFFVKVRDAELVSLKKYMKIYHDGILIRTNRYGLRFMAEDEGVCYVYSTSKFAKANISVIRRNVIRRLFWHASLR